MTTTDERVKVTPELLADLEAKAYRGFYIGPCTTLDLVQRIRELELRLAISKDALSAELGEDRVRRDNALALGPLTQPDTHCRVANTP